MPASALPVVGMLSRSAPVYWPSFIGRQVAVGNLLFAGERVDALTDVLDYPITNPLSYSGPSQVGSSATIRVSRPIRWRIDYDDGRQLLVFRHNGDVLDPEPRVPRYCADAGWSALLRTYVIDNVARLSRFVLRISLR